MTEFFYRFDDSSYSYETVFIHERKIPVLRKTRCGAWLDDYGRERFVLFGDGKRWAYPTREDAWASFQIRKRRQLGHLQAQLRHVEFVRNHVKDLSLPAEHSTDCWRIGKAETILDSLDPVGQLT